MVDNEYYHQKYLKYKIKYNILKGGFFKSKNDCEIIKKKIKINDKEIQTATKKLENFQLQMKNIETLKEKYTKEMEK
jgi:hypothetical protein